MPRIVHKVPQPWEPYMNGRLWEFTAEEMEAMPSFRPMQNLVTGELVGMRMMQWCAGGKYYIRFFNASEPMDPEELAGWKD